MAKEEKKMATKPTESKTVETPVPVIPISLIETSDLSPKQKVMDLKTGKEAEISFTYQKFSVADVVNTDPEKLAAAINEAQKILGSGKVLLEALLYRATQVSYQNAKATALSKGNYLTQELRTKIVAFMRQQSQFAELSASDAFDRWKTGYLAGKSGAKKILDIVSQAPDEFGDL